jgi:hypothetical protein
LKARKKENTGKEERERMEKVKKETRPTADRRNLTVSLMR